MATPDPTEVAPWYLRNINQALALDEASGNVYVRTGFTGNIVISGNVNVPGNIDAHISEIGTSGNLTVPWMPVSIDGNSAVTITSGNITVAQGTSPWVVSGNVNANVTGNVGVTGNVNANITGGNVNAAVTGTVAVSGITGNIAGITSNVNIGTMPAITGNVNAAVTGTVAVSSVSGNVTVVDGGGSLTVDGTVGVTGNVNIGTMPNVNANITGGNVTVQQGTSPWVVTGNVTTSLVGNANTVISGFSGTTSDAFGRLRVSEPFTLFDTQQRYYDHGQFSSSTSGTATVTYEANSSTFTLGIGINSGDSIIRETKRVFPYQPGKSLLTLMSFCMSTPKANLRQRVGFFGAQNGIYFETAGTTLNMVIRSYTSGAIVEDRIPQSAWNGDRLDGSGGANNPSGIVLNPALDQIFWTDVEWLGVGSVRMGFIINGTYYTCHTFHHSNIVGNTTTYMTTATLPLRYEITNTGATISNSTLRQICCTVISEGGYNNFGTTQTAGTGTTQKRLANSNTYYPIVSIRLNSSRLDSIVLPRQIDVLSPSVNYYRWVLLQNTTLTGATWATTSPTGTVDIDLAATALSGGTEIQSGYAASRELTQLSSVDFFQYQLGRTLAGVSDVVTLAIAATANNADVLAELGWQELT